MSDMTDVKQDISKNFFRVSAEDFKKIPGSPIAYWISKTIHNIFHDNIKAKEVASSRAGMTSGNNDKFTRQWYEILFCDINYSATHWENAIFSGGKWFPYNKGGAYRKWYGNISLVIRYDSVTRDLLKKTGNHCASEDCYFQEGVTWTDLTSGSLGARFLPSGTIFDIAGHCAFSIVPNGHLLSLAMLNTKFISQMSKVINASFHFQPGDFRKLPFPKEINKKRIIDLVHKLITVSVLDWSYSETSWDFIKLPLIETKAENQTLSEAYKTLRQKWMDMTLEMQKLEEENNRIFIEAYGLQDELTPEVPLKEITLTCNPYYRYGDKKSEKELESLLLTDTMKELVSYAVGCIFGRYSLDKGGLILANAGDGIDEYLKQIPEPSFMPDKSGILPITDENDFTDDLTSQFKTFLKASFGSENFEENLRFVEEAIGKDIRTFFIKDFYKDHVKRYKKRPIYWLISSPSGVFKSLIYLHRYTKDTIGQFLNDYLRPYRKKLEAKLEQNNRISISADASPGEKTRALKRIDILRKNIKELEEWERDAVYPLASKRIELDLDDGVKVNYGKLGSILEKVKGLNG